jgi:tripartite-type tricarboxylate transporter receptor subunit TctC
MRRCALLVFALLACASVAAADFPSKPLRIIVPFPPGGGTDLMSRLLAPGLSASLGQPVLVENRSGAGGNIASAFVASAPADGHTLLTVGPHLAIAVPMYKKLPFDTRRDLAPVAMVGEVPMVLLVSPRLKVNSVGELVQLLRSEPGKLNFSSNGIGVTPHMAAELFKMQAGVYVVHIPYRGSADAEQAVMTGDAAFLFENLAVTLPLIRSGRLRALAVTSAARHPLLPDVPTMVESGYPKFTVTVWFGLATTGGTPPEDIARLAAAVKRVLAEPEIRAVFEKQNMAVHFMGSKDFGAFIDAEIAKWTAAVKYSGATVE